MLKIKTVLRYTIPQYPQGVYTKCPDFISLSTPRGVLAAATLALMLDACSEIGPGTVTSGVPPWEPGTVTESEARDVIDRVFSDAGISLTHDVDVKIETAPADIATVNVDGFDTSLQVGYEYLGEADYNTFTPQVRETLDSLEYESGPYIMTTDSILTVNVARLEAVAQEFIDSLRANGAI